jgi:hypothetical protein
MTARQQLARLLPLALLILLAMAGLRGVVAAPKWNGPLRSEGVTVGLILEVVLGVLLAVTLRRERTARRAGLSDSDDGRQDDGRQNVPGALRFVLIRLLGAGMAAVALLLIFAPWPGKLWSEPEGGAGAFTYGLIWAGPYTPVSTYVAIGDRPWFKEYHWTGLQNLAGNAYILTGIAMLAILAVVAWRMSRGRTLRALLLRS